MFVSVHLGQRVSEFYKSWATAIAFRSVPEHLGPRVEVPAEFAGRDPVICEIRVISGDALALRIDLQGSDFTRQLWFTLSGQKIAIISARVGDW